MYPKGDLLIPASHGHLEAMLKEPKGAAAGTALVCHPHPLGGGTMHNKVVFRAAAGLVDAGLTTLKFNFRGVGSSTGVHNEIEGGKEDVGDALDYLAKTYPSMPITVAGFSFGARTGLEVAHTYDRVERLISIGTPVDKYGDFRFLVGLTKPILFVHGDRDEFGAVENLRQLFDQVKRTSDATLVVFDDCGHFFDGHLSDLRETVSSWTSKQLKRSRD
ncbi:MAG: alpha/beta fold hydrolase [Acidobacteriota bacterium]